jgi:peptidoglycan/xylan/chitin deacetylase (PgdA/CDA1 family)
MTAGPADPHPSAVVHVDLDGAGHIYRAHGWRYDEGDDPLFESGLRGALDLFARAQIPATLFVIAEDAAHPRKRALIQEAIDAGHEIASHSLTHRRLTVLTRAEKWREISESRSVLADTFGVPVRGFRAPGFHRDSESLELIGEAGYAYDSSELAGTHRQPRAPYHPLSGRPLVELPVPSMSPLSLPFHPSYSLVLGQWYFRAGLAASRRRPAPFVLLFHLTDFADPLPSTRVRAWQQRLFTLSHATAQDKRARSAAMLGWVKQSFTVRPTTPLVDESQRGLSHP